MQRGRSCPRCMALALRDNSAPDLNCCNIAMSLIDPVLSANAWLRQSSLERSPPHTTVSIDKEKRRAQNAFPVGFAPYFSPSSLGRLNKAVGPT